MSQSQLNKLVERIVYRYEVCGMDFSSAVKDVLQWFGRMRAEDVIYVTCNAGKQTIASL